MRILEIITEKTSHAMDINRISAHIANYIKTAWLPAAQEASNNGEKLTNGPYQHIEKAILSGRGVPAGKRDFSEYYFWIGDAAGMVPDNTVKSDEVAMILPRINIYMIPEAVVGGTAGLPDDEYDEYSITLNSNHIIGKNGKIRLGDTISLLTHEIRHALDNHLSGGRAPFYKRKGGPESDSADFGDENSSYYTNQTEANARFSQVENRLINKLESEKGNKEYTKEKYIEDVKKAFRTFHISKGEMKFTNSEKQYRRFINRALDLYSENQP